MMMNYCCFLVNLSDLQMYIPMDDGKIKKDKVLYHLIPSICTMIKVQNTIM